MRIYVYKCVVDDGGAPCVDEGLLTLTICKPYIRSTATKGDLIFAFGSNWERHAPRNRLVYIARITRPALRRGRYFKAPEYAQRQDCIYEWIAGKLEWKSGAGFHARGLGKKSDIGFWPHYRNANAIVSDDFRYFGAEGDATWKEAAPKMTVLVEGLGQGHRVNFSTELQEELLALKNAQWRRHPSRQVLGAPLHASGTTARPGGEDACLVEISPPRCRTRCDGARAKLSCRPIRRCLR